MKTLIYKSFLILLFISTCIQVGNAQMSGVKIGIDPGHGGSDPGALGVNGSATPDEADIVLTVSLHMRNQLQGLGATVVMTRTTDTYPSLTARKNLMNQQNPDAFVSIHENSFTSSSANGTETLHRTTATSSTISFAQKVQNKMVADMGFTNRGLKPRNNLTVLTVNSSIPTILTEGCFLSNSTEWNYITQLSNQQCHANAIKNGILDFLNYDSSISSNCSTTGGGGNTCTTPTYAQQYYSNLTSTSVRIYCTASGNLRDIQIRAGTSGAWTDYSAFSANNKYISGLQSGTYYQFRTRRQCTNGVWSSWSGAEYFNTPSNTCTAPSYAQQYYSNLTNTSVRIYCTASGNLRDIQLRAGTSGTWTDYSAFSGSYKYVSGLQPGTYYQFRTRRQCTNGIWSSWSGAEYFNTPSGTCTAPSYAQQYYSSLTDTSVRIYCTASGSRDVQLRAGTSGAWTDYTSFTGSYKYVGGLQPGTYYQFRTRRYCSGIGWSGWSGAEYFNTPSSKYEQDGLTKVSLAPNPVRTGAEARLTIESGFDETARMIVTDISGRMVYEQELTLDSGSNEISLRAFDTAGMYIIAIQSASANATLKLVVAE